MIQLQLAASQLLALQMRMALPFSMMPSATCWCVSNSRCCRRDCGPCLDTNSIVLVPNAFRASAASLVLPLLAFDMNHAMQPSGSAAVDDVTADSDLSEQVTILVPTNAAIDRNTTRGLARSGNLQDVRC